MAEAKAKNTQTEQKVEQTPQKNKIKSSGVY